MEKNSGFHVSKQQQQQQQNTDYNTEVYNRLEQFVNYFVKYFEAKLYFYHLILEGEVKKAGKFSDTFSETVGGAFGGLIGLILGLPEAGATLGAKGGKKVGNVVGNKHHTKKVVKLLDLIDDSQKDKVNFKRELVEAGLDIFQSFEMQFMRVTTDEGSPKAIRQLAEDATNRAINYLKKKKDVSLSESAISGKSKKEVYSISPGFEIQYEYQLCKYKWNTSSLYDKAGLVIENKTTPSYYKKKGEKSKTSKYGYRRLLKLESWDILKEQYDSDKILESKNGQFTEYKYIIIPKILGEMTQNVLDNLNDKYEHLEEDRIKKILEDVKYNILNEIDVLKKQSYGYNEDREILKNLEGKIKNLKINEYLEKFQQYFEELKQEIHKIKDFIEEVRKENKEEHIKIEQEINLLNQKFDKFDLQETRTEGVISELDITKYYYMPRILNRYIEIKRNFKEEKSEFFITENGHVDKSKLQKNQDIVLISNMHKDFEKLCKEHTDRNIHWLKEVEGKFKWQLSFNSLSKLREFVDDKVQSRQVDKISNIEDKVVIISAEPGMGKSTLFSHLAVEQQKASTSVKVNKINLNDHTYKLSLANFESINEVFEFLMNISDIKNSLQNLQSSIFLFDGFDEIASNSDYKGKTLKLLKLFKNDVKHLWITTRPYARNDLEDKLSVFSYTIEPLSDVMQKEFLQKFWKTNFIFDVIKQLAAKIHREIEDKEIENLVDKVSKIIELEIVEFNDDDDNLKQIQSLISEFDISKKVVFVAKRVNLINKQHNLSEKIQDVVEIFKNASNLEEIKDIINTEVKRYAEEIITKFSKSVSDKEKEFTGVPLQITMLAEAFQEQLYDNFVKLYYLEPTQRWLDKSELSERLNLLDLYECFIENKRKINFVEKGNMDLTNETALKEYKNSRKRFIKNHQLLALSSLLSTRDLKKLLTKEEKEKVKDLNRNIGDGSENTGIVYQIIGNKPYFIHRTFAEYFTADFFVGRITDTQKREFLREYIFKVENEVIRHFFDRMLIKGIEGENHGEIHLAVLNNDQDKIVELLSDSQNTQNIINSLDKGGRTALHLAAYINLDIVRILLEHGASIDIKCQIFAWTPLAYADKSGHWHIAELLLQKGANGDDMFEAKKNIYIHYRSKKKLLHIAAINGYISLAKELVKTLNADFRATDIRERTPLHFAAAYGNLEIVKFLVNQDPKTLRWEDHKRKTPLDLAIYHDHLEIVRYLSKRPNMTRTELEEMQLNYAVTYSDYKFVNQLLERGVNINSEVLGWTPLHQAATRCGLKMVRLLVEKGAKIDNQGNYCSNANVKCGSTNKTTFNILKCINKVLTDENVDIKIANKDGYTPLHCAVKNKSLNVVKYLIDQFYIRTIDINITDKRGLTFLDCANRECKDKIVEYLKEKEANISPIDK